VGLSVGDPVSTGVNAVSAPASTLPVSTVPVSTVPVSTIPVSAPASGSTTGGAHVPDVQTFGAAQSPVVVQLVAHAVPAHAYGAHAVGVVVVQLPVPSQLSLGVAPAAVQLAAAHSLSGSVPPAIGAQVPLAPPVLLATHAWQAPVHVVSQHTPSTQLPLWH
jgi:hypothetical protein